MEYSFTRNDIDQPVARLNMEAEAFGHWLNIEMSHTRAIELQKIAQAVDQLLHRQGWEHEFAGREFHLVLSRHQATVSANTILQQQLEVDVEIDEFDLEFSDDYAEDELSEGAAGMVASCGLEDFQTLLLAWIEYLQH